jgi:carbon monoxide dehydrogenase subunit G
MKIGLSRTSVSGSLSVDLAPDGAGTLLTYNAQGTLNGAFAMLDNPLTRPLIDGQIGQFFSKLEAQIS